MKLIPTRLKLPRLTFRARLALVYGGLVLLVGISLLGVTYALVSSQLPHSDQLFRGCVTQVNGTPTPAPRPSAAPSTGPGQDCFNVPVGSGQLYVRQFVDSTRDTALRTLLTQGGIALAVVCAVATLFAWLVAGRLLQPLHQMTETARRIADAPDADRGLHERIALNGPHDEVQELADTFDLMLERLDHSFDSQRRFIANASHELRTPLTLNRTLLEVALEPESTPPEVRQLGLTLLAVNTRHEKLIDGLLLLARSERYVTDRSYVDLADIVEHVVEHVPPDKVTIRTEPGEAPTEGNPVLLERLVQNLVQNALTYNVPDGWVAVRTCVQSGQATLVVENTGPVVPAYEIPGLFEPFRRLRDRTGSAHGTGLGLSIVRAVAVSHGGRVDAVPRDGGGLVVTVTLPAPQS